MLLELFKLSFHWEILRMNLIFQFSVGLVVTLYFPWVDFISGRLTVAMHVSNISLVVMVGVIAYVFKECKNMACLICYTPMATCQ